MTKQPELKPCPFCGKKPVLADDDPANTYIYCDNAKCQMCPDTLYASRRKVIRLWNTRKGEKKP